MNDQNVNEQIKKCRWPRGARLGKKQKNYNGKLEIGGEANLSETDPFEICDTSNFKDMIIACGSCYSQYTM